MLTHRVIFLLLSLCLWASSVTALDNGLGLLPPRGWNTWCTDGTCERDVCTETEVRAIGDALVSSGLRDLGYNYVNLDDCWADSRDEHGNIQPDPTRFPSGMKATADYLHDRGLKFGLYTDSGVYTCSSGGRDHKIPGSYGHYEQDAMTYAAWGMDYVKMDWCNTKINGTQLEPEIQYSQMSAALNKTGRPIYFLTCEWGVDGPWAWMRTFANAWRATGDHHDEWSSTSSVIGQVALLEGFAGPGGWNYMDFLMTGGQGCPNDHPMTHCPGQTDDEYRTEFSMWVMASSPLIVATDVRNLTAIMKEVLFNTELLDIHHDRLARAGGQVGSWDCSEGPAACQIWARPLYDGSFYVALYNAGTIQHDITFDYKLVGWAPHVFQARVRDLWAHKDMGVHTGSFTATVAPHAVAALRVSLVVPQSN